jgi:hypothetical protein
MNEKNQIYGPPIIYESKSNFYLRKFKRELSFCKILIINLVLLSFTIPLFSYEFLREYSLSGRVSMFNVFRNVGKSLFVIAPAYAALSAYFMYIPKEKYWDKLQKQNSQIPTLEMNNIKKKKLLDQLKEN